MAIGSSTSRAARASQKPQISNNDAKVTSSSSTEVDGAETKAANVKDTAPQKPASRPSENAPIRASSADQQASRAKAVAAGNQIQNALNLAEPPPSMQNTPRRGLAKLESQDVQTADVLARGASGPQVAEFQQSLKDMGFAIGKVDGKFGPGTEKNVKQFQAGQGLEQSGVVNAQTLAALQKGLPKASPAAGTPGITERTPYGRYKPNSPEAKALFTAAAKEAGLPESWGSSAALHGVLAKETQGRVGIPNYTFGKDQTHTKRWAQVHGELKSGLVRTKSTATGLGQMTLPNVDKYYPDGRDGIGDPKNEAIGMLKYIKDRYGSPKAALAFHEKNHWY